MLFPGALSSRALARPPLSLPGRLVFLGNGKALKREGRCEIQLDGREESQASGLRLQQGGKRKVGMEGALRCLGTETQAG